MRTVLIGSALAIVMALPAVQAQQAPPASPPAAQPDAATGAPTDAATETAPAGAAGDIVRRVQEGSELRSDWIQGTTVTTPDGETIGKIDDLLIDADSGTVTAAVLSVGGFLGIGAKSIAVNWADLQMQYDGSEITLAMSKEEADAAPEFEFRDQEQPPPPAGATGGTGGTGMGGAGGTGGMGGAGTPPATGR